MGGKSCCLLKGGIRKFFAFGFHDNVRTRCPLGVEPPVAAGSDLECELVILVIIFSNVHVVSIRGDVVVRA